MISLKRKQSGFTIVELLIVIVVIGILAALVVTTFSGIQRKARNTERETDVKAIHGQLEAAFAANNSYPTLSEINDTTWRGNNVKGLDADALKDPKGTAQALVASPSATAYSYDVTPAGCASGACTGYKLTGTLEGGGVFEKVSLN